MSLLYSNQAMYSAAPQLAAAASYYNDDMMEEEEVYDRAESMPMAEMAMANMARA